MNLIVLNRCDYTPIFSTTIHTGIIKIMQENTIEMVNKGEVTKKQDPYQLVIHVNKNVIFGGIRPFGDKYRRKIMDFDKMLEFISKISNLLLNNAKNIEDFEPIFNKIFIENSKTIRLIGYNADVNTIMYLIEGITISSIWEDQHVVCIGNNEFIKLQKSSGSRSFDQFLKKIHPNGKNAFYVINYSDKGKITEENQFTWLLREAKMSQNVLVLVNKQDLTGTMNSEDIKEIKGCPTVSFSTIAPDAPERLEKIISNFLDSN